MHPEIFNIADFHFLSGIYFTQKLGEVIFYMKEKSNLKRNLKGKKPKNCLISRFGQRNDF